MAEEEKKEEGKEKQENQDEVITYFIQPKDVIMDVNFELQYNIPKQK